MTTPLPAQRRALPHSVQELSPRLLGCAAALFVVGLLAGGVLTLQAAPPEERQLPGTAAWWPHLAFGVLALVLLLVAR